MTEHNEHYDDADEYVRLRPIGYNAGRTEGRTDGYTEGCIEGYTEGYREGFIAGMKHQTVINGRQHHD